MQRVAQLSRNTGLFSIPLGLALMLEKPTLDNLDPVRDQAQRRRSKLRSLARRSYLTTFSRSVGAPFQVCGKLGVGRSGGIEKTSLISFTSEVRRTRPRMMQ